MLSVDLLDKYISLNYYISYTMDQIVRLEIGTYVTRLLVPTRFAVLDLSARVTHSSLSAAPSKTPYPRCY